MKKFIVLVLGILLAIPSYSMKIAGKNLPDTLKFGDATLVLNGAGIRKKFWVKVYAGGLYLTKKSHNAKAIINADEPMAVRLHFIYDGVSSKKMRGAWEDSFEEVLSDNELMKLKNKIKLFESFFDVETHEDDIWDLVYIPGVGTKVLLNGKEKGVVPGLDFKKALFSIYLSEKTEIPDVREAMLGLD
ncbi:conserved hypothetical protein [Thermotomaculum hydrothermale]|uniref:Chalcone isomerase domain-containing protein n=1 Tax=Thermotomaculum hydrothermale TaxID=981385 RepID=A0A7R6PMX5_9BACT|nr:chalcone isomerase family protein [Thermotomaculum hydrothermale]BBB32046.1 conserved hypothetical protein [Thermotomaculum hydrothermale]